jgi:ornithine carbamoyltransferase
MGEDEAHSVRDSFRMSGGQQSLEVPNDVFESRTAMAFGRAANRMHGGSKAVATFGS